MSNVYKLVILSVHFSSQRVKAKQLFLKATIFFTRKNELPQVGLNCDKLHTVPYMCCTNCVTEAA